MPDRRRVETRRQHGGAAPRRVRRGDAVVEEAVARHGHSIDATLPVLQDVQAVRGRLSENAIIAVAEALGQSASEVFGTASFYSLLSTEPRAEHVVRVCDGPVCRLRGAANNTAALQESAEHDSKWCIERTSCLGLCDRAPAALVDIEPCGPIEEFTWEQICKGQRGTTVTYDDPLPGEVRVAMQRVGRVDPNSIESAIANGAYEGLKTAIRETPGHLVSLIEDSGLRGCGGAGYPTGRKWRSVAESDSATKHVICNADESEPGAFKDRVLIEGDPHRVIEGLTLAGFAVGATEGIIYLRGEYERAARILANAIDQARQFGWLGRDINGSDFSFDLRLHRGAGAYICGEETAMLESLEGRRGEPRLRPPYPTEHGYHGRPTVVNNVETLCHVPAIIERGAAWFRSRGTTASLGTKLFCVSGSVNRPGVVEVPYGVTARTLIEEFGGGMLSGSRFKMALCGGAAGSVIPESLLDVPIDFESSTAGVPLGSGVIVAIDHSVSAVTLLLWLLNFFEAESCGKCTPCRIGTFQAREILQRIDRGQGQDGDCNDLARLAGLLETASLCGLGQSVALPIHSALEHFLGDFQDGGAT